jgi:hypothetical protein
VPLLGLSRVAASGAVLAGVMSVGGRVGVPPDSCKFVSVAEVTELIGKAVGGGQQSVVDNPKSLTSSCAYTVSGIPTVIVLVGDYQSPGVAKKEFTHQMGNSPDNKAETGIGDSAFLTSADVLSITAVQGPRLATIAIVGGDPALHDRLHALMVKALSR